MATLERIRSKAGILVAVVIGLALLAFILSDVFDSRKSIFRNGKLEVGEISGTSISTQELDKEINQLEEVYKLTSNQAALDERTSESIREQAWASLINKLVMDVEYNKLGVVVSSDELLKLVSGENPHPIILQLFTNPETGQFNKQLLVQYLKTKGEDQTGGREAYWLAIEKEIVNQKLNEKYTTLISKGLTAPEFMAKNDFAENNKKVDVNFIVEHLNTVSDSLIKLTNSDLKEYYNNHKYLYEQNASREIEYVIFNVTASEEDNTAANDWINKIKPDFQTTDEVEAFVNANSENNYIDKNYKKDEIADSAIASFAFSSKAGDVYGPYLEGSSYKLAKLYKVLELPDSVKIRHILIRPKGQTENDVTVAKNLADSLFKVLEANKGASFEELALANSDDAATKTKGGDLGWIKDGSIGIKEFNDAAFENPKGSIKLVASNAGFQVIQIMDKGKEVKKVKIAYLERKISPSTQTFHNVYAKAVKFAGENTNYDTFKASATKQNYIVENATIGESDKNIPGIDSPRNLLHWIFDVKEKQISEPLELGNSYVVAVVTRIRKKGTTPLEYVKNEVELAVRRQKKAEKIIEKINNAMAGVSDIHNLGTKLNLPVESAEGISFTSFTVGNAGFEPKIVALAVSQPKNKISQPLDGMNGVYVLTVNNIVETPPSEFIPNLSRMNSTLQSRATYDARNALIKLADIKDYRNKYY